MRCPYCHFRDSKVTDSRANDDGIRRRRQCISCGERFTTVEAVQLMMVQIIKKDGRREEFSRDKLYGGLRRACEKLPIAVAQLDEMVDDVEARVTGDGSAEVPSALIGELAMDALRKLNHIAYIRFACVYRSFTDFASLKNAIADVEEGRIPTIEEKTLQLPLLDPEDARRPRPIMADLDQRPPVHPPLVGARA